MTRFAKNLIVGDAESQAKWRRGAPASPTANAFIVSHLMVIKRLLLLIAGQKFLRERERERERLAKGHWVTAKFILCQSRGLGGKT